MYVHAKERCTPPLLPLVCAHLMSKLLTISVSVRDRNECLYRLLSKVFAFNRSACLKVFFFSLPLLHSEKKNKKKTNRISK